jgi:cystathionine gamma-synthase
MDPNVHPSTKAVIAGRPPRIPDNPVNTPIVPASTFHAEGPTEYAREGNPSAAAFEEALGSLENGHATVFSSGMAAANAILDLVPLGSTVIATTNTYTGVAVRLKELSERGVINVILLPALDSEAIIAALPQADFLWLESPTNPLLDEVDLASCLAAAQEHNVISVVDNTFASPVAQRPLTLGADYVLHSVTKILSGHSDLLMGAVVTSDPELTEDIRIRRILLGAMPSAFDCFLALRGLRTLFLRFEKSEANARAIVEKLRSDSRVSKVRYPGWGTIAAIEVLGNADHVCQATKIWTYATSLGGVESLLERRRRWPLESHTVPENLIRLSFGIEHPDDLWIDLDAALNTA